MTKKSVLISIFTGLLLGFMIIRFNPLQNVDASLDEPRMRFSVSPAEAVELETALLKLLNSHHNWQTIQGEIQVFDYLQVGSEEIYTSTISIEASQPRYFFAQSVDINNEQFAEVIDFDEACESHIATGHYVCQNIHDATYMMELEQLPQTLVNVNALKTEEGIPMVVPHPMGLRISPIIAELLYPTKRPQRLGNYLSIESTQFLGRDAWLINWEQHNNSNQLTGKEQFWVDQQTGVVLRIERFDTQHPDRLLQAFTFTTITFDSPVTQNGMNVFSDLNLERATPHEYFNLPEGFGTRD